MRRTQQSTDQLVDLLDTWRTRKIVVVGDFMLDRYIYGDADRLSPDAPVPVLARKRTEQVGGGASNVCADLAALKCQVRAVGVVGRDDAGRDLRQALRAAGCSTAGLVSDGSRPTTVKMNLVGLAQHRHPQKMFRLDEESSAPLDPGIAATLLDRARRALRGAAALCLEDYNKGVLHPKICTALIRMARSAGVPVFVDPAPIPDYAKYGGATCITPNRNEASLATKTRFSETLRVSVLRTMTTKLIRSLRLESCVVTLDKHGLFVAENRNPPTLVPTKARAVYDVTGAGDVVVAAIAAARTNGAGWLQAAELANVAAGLAVEKFGAVPVDLDEALLAILEDRRKCLGKQRLVDQLATEIAAHRRQGKRIVFTNGCFDILHAGHVAFLREARARGDLLVVGLNSDDSIRRFKGPQRPVNHLDDRLLVLSELTSVDYITIFTEKTPIKLIRAIRPDVLVKGNDYTRAEVVGGNFVESYGGHVHLVKLVKGRSTTNIIRKIEDGRR